MLLGLFVLIHHHGLKILINTIDQRVGTGSRQTSNRRFARKSTPRCRQGVARGLSAIPASELVRHGQSKDASVGKQLNLAWLSVAVMIIFILAPITSTSNRAATSPVLTKLRFTILMLVWTTAACIRTLPSGVKATTRTPKLRGKGL